MVFNTLPFSIPTKLCDLFISNRDTCFDCNIIFKIQINPQRGNASVSDELKMTANFTASSFKAHVHRKIIFYFYFYKCLL